MSIQTLKDSEGVSLLIKPFSAFLWQHYFLKRNSFKQVKNEKENLIKKQKHSAVNVQQISQNNVCPQKFLEKQNILFDLNRKSKYFSTLLVIQDKMKKKRKWFVDFYFHLTKNFKFESPELATLAWLDWFNIGNCT